MRSQLEISRELAFGAHMTGPSPTSTGTQVHAWLRVLGQDMVDLQEHVPHFFEWSNKGIKYPWGTRADFGAVGTVDGRNLWGSDFCVHLHDDADGGVATRLKMKIHIRGVSMTGRPLEEIFEIECQERGEHDEQEGFLADAYYRSRFAYGWFRIKILEYEGTPTTDDYIHIGFDPTDHYDPVWKTHARERDVRWGLPFPAQSIQDIQCVKIDRTPVGVGLANDFAKNIRGIYVVDLMEDGALFDIEDNAIIVNDAFELTRGHLYDAEGEGFTLEESPSLGNFVLLFSVDAEHPDRFVQPQIVFKYDAWFSFKE